MISVERHDIVGVEGYGIQVLRIATDNAKTNVSLFKKLGGSDTTFIIPHPLDESRKLFLSYDYTHLLKNVRNLWIDRPFLINGSPVLFTPLVKIYNETKNDVFKPVRHLTRKVVEPTNLERQKVR